ncbi:MAG: prephenate dehydrogenase [Phycisphaerales bacterium]|nr:prephenate dehydrogenase [Phycisphaerales bacterium]
MPAAPSQAPLGILGFGHFGRAIAALAEAQGLPYFAHDPDPATAFTIPTGRAAVSPEELARQARTLILCIPIPALAPTLAALRPHLSADHFILDVGSVKVQPAAEMARILGSDIPWCATHPLFGPAALARGERPLRAIICPNDQHPAAARRAAALYRTLGCETTELSPDDHDRLMADTHALAFFVARAMLDLGLPPDSAFVPPSFHAMAQTIDTVRADATHLFDIIQQANPHAAVARERLLEALKQIHAQLLDQPRNPD